MEATENTARQQFVEDYLLVTDNSEVAYTLHMQLAREAEGKVSQMSDKVREIYENAISAAVERERGISGHITADLIAQVMLGWGSAPFDDIARHYIDLDLESRLQVHFDSLLKTGEK
jgi:hypothetical protein